MQIILRLIPYCRLYYLQITASALNCRSLSSETLPDNTHACISIYTTASTAHPIHRPFPQGTPHNAPGTRGCTGVFPDTEPFCKTRPCGSLGLSRSRRQLRVCLWSNMVCSPTGPNRIFLTLASPPQSEPESSFGPAINADIFVIHTHTRHASLQKIQLQDAEAGAELPALGAQGALAQHCPSLANLLPSHGFPKPPPPPLPPFLHGQMTPAKSAPKQGFHKWEQLNRSEESQWNYSAVLSIWGFALVSLLWFNRA